MSFARTRLILGKGGVGKSVVAEGLAAAAGASASTLLVRVGESVGRADPKLRPAPSGFGYDVVDLDPRTAMDDFVEHVVRVRALASRITTSDVYRRFFAAAPGLPELVLLGRIRAYAEDGDPRTRKRYGEIVVDCPSSGHGLLMLETPYAARRAVSVGPFGRLATQIVEWEETAVELVAVAIPEEMAVVETIEFSADLAARTSLRIHAAVMNRLRAVPLGAETAEAVLNVEPDLPGDLRLIECGRLAMRRARLEAFHTRRLTRGLGVRVTRLRELDPPSPEAISRALGGALS